MYSYVCIYTLCYALLALSRRAWGAAPSDSSEHAQNQSNKTSVFPECLKPHVLYTITKSASQHTVEDLITLLSHVHDGRGVVAALSRAPSAMIKARSPTFLSKLCFASMQGRLGMTSPILVHGCIETIHFPIAEGALIGCGHRLSGQCISYSR